MITYSERWLDSVAEYFITNKISTRLFLTFEDFTQLVTQNKWADIVKDGLPEQIVVKNDACTLMITDEGYVAKSIDGLTKCYGFGLSARSNALMHFQKEELACSKSSQRTFSVTC